MIITLKIKRTGQFREIGAAIPGAAFPGAVILARPTGRLRVEDLETQNKTGNEKKNILFAVSSPAV